MTDKQLSVIYFGDETTFRKKQCGLTLIEQLLLSVKSLRSNWSKAVNVYFFHSSDLSNSTKESLLHLNVTTKKSNRVIESEFPLSNKILVGELYRSNNNILFLDCDTIIHKPIEIDINEDMYVTYDALKNLTSDEYNSVMSHIHIDKPKGEIFESPSFEYYYHDNLGQFPVFNSGVFFLKKSLQKSFYFEYEQTFKTLYDKFKTDRWRFYIEQIAFCMTITKLKINYSIFPKGYNYICTPRADFLKDWDKNKIIIEHYAGDNGRPINI